MKKLTLSFLATLAVGASAFAGQPMVSGKEYKTVAPEPCFKDVELQIDVFATYFGGGSDSLYSDGFGGGLGVNYFFTRNFGIAVSGALHDGGDHEVWNADLDLVARFPIEGAVCVAPYILAGGGIEADGTTIGTWNVGGGLEWRATPSIGIFGEGRYMWGAADEGTALARVGLRFVF